MSAVRRRAASGLLLAVRLDLYNGQSVTELALLHLQRRQLGYLAVAASRQQQQHHQPPAQQALLPWAARPLAAQHLPALSRALATAPGSKGQPAGSEQPGAEECDEAMQEYDELRGRFERVKRPSTMKTTDERIRSFLRGFVNFSITFVRYAIKTPGYLIRVYNTPREEWRAWWAGAWKTIKHEAHHYWVGFKLLATEARIASRLAIKAARGTELTRRERRQLTRTVADLFRCAPSSSASTAQRRRRLPGVGFRRRRGVETGVAAACGAAAWAWR